MKPGLNSLKNALKKAKENDIKEIFLETEIKFYKNNREINVSEINVSACSLCSLGQTTNVKGASSCLECPIGSYGIRPGECVACPIGNFSNSKGAISCSTCKKGEKYINTKTNCISCGLGRRGTAKGFCEDCPSGTYQNGRGQITCKLFCKKMWILF